MRERVVAVMGAGSLRCGPPVLASLAAWMPDDLVDVHLWDANEERLDLFDRFLRACLDKAGTLHSVKASSDHLEALEGATDVIFTLHEDCARRLLGRRPAQLFTHDEPFLVGDPNKPTPPDQLSPHAQVILSNPAEDNVTRWDVMVNALDKLLWLMPESARALNLVRGVDVASPEGVVNVAWPPEVPQDKLALVPHQVLRWIYGEESLRQLLVDSLESPVSAWLNGKQVA